MEKKEEKLSKKLIEKSIEAFILGLEIYNKPTIRYRIEGFSFFICNAWELMLKAHIIKTKGEKYIYYKDSSSRTLSLEASIKLIMTNKNSLIRKNLEKIIELRNISTHFITEDYEYIYAPLFQANVLNFIEKIREYHSVEITDYIAQNFITLTTSVNQLSEIEIKTKYTPNMAKELLLRMKEVEINKVNNVNYSVELATKFYITKNEKDADMSINISKNSEVSAAVIREIKDPNVLYPYTTNDVIRLVNKKLKVENILITQYKNSEKVLVPFNKYHFNLFSKFYNIKEDEKYCFYYGVAKRYSYSAKVCDFIVNEIKRDSENIINILKEKL